MRKTGLVWRRAGELGCFLLFSPALLLFQPVREYWKELLAASLTGYLVARAVRYRGRQVDERFGLNVVSSGRAGTLYSSKYQLSIEWELMGGKYSKAIYLSGVEAAIPMSEREEFRHQIIRFFEAHGERVEIA